MDSPLNASANSAGAVFSNNMFEIPRFQREYSWGDDEVEEFWIDLKGSLELDSYFLGLMIFTNPTEDGWGRKRVSAAGCPLRVASCPNDPAGNGTLTTLQTSGCRLGRRVAARPENVRAVAARSLKLLVG
jgi:hypothetical protein